MQKKKRFKNKELLYIDWVSKNGKVSIEERMKLCKDAGFFSVSISWGGGSYYPENENPFLIYEEALKQELKVDVAHLQYTGANSLWVEDEEQILFLNTIKWIELCGKYNKIKMLVIHLTENVTPPEPSKIGLSRIKKLVEIAKKNDVILAVENVENNDTIDYVLKHIKSKYLKVCFDTGHANCFGDKNVLKLLKKYKKRIGCFHIHDNSGEKDEHLLVGEGNINFEEVFRECLKTKAKYYVCEIFPNPRTPTFEEYQAFTKKVYSVVNFMVK